MNKLAITYRTPQGATGLCDFIADDQPAADERLAEAQLLHPDFHYEVVAVTVSPAIPDQPPTDWPPTNLPASP